MENNSEGIVRNWYESGNTSLLSPDVDWRVLSTFPSGGIYTGPEEVVGNFFPAVKGHFADYRTVPEEYISHGTRVVSRGRYCIMNHASERVEAEFAHFWTVQDGLITSFRQITDTAAIASITRSES